MVYWACSRARAQFSVGRPLPRAREPLFFKGCLLLQRAALGAAAACFLSRECGGGRKQNAYRAPVGQQEGGLLGVCVLVCIGGTVMQEQARLGRGGKTPPGGGEETGERNSDGAAERGVGWGRGWGAKHGGETAAARRKRARCSQLVPPAPLQKYVARTNLANLAVAAPSPPSVAESAIVLAPCVIDTRASSFLSTAGSPGANFAPFFAAST